MRRALILLLVAIALIVPAASGAGMDSSALLEVSAWTSTPQPTVWPSVGGYDVSSYNNLGGYLGLDPTPPRFPVSTGEITFRWYADPAAEQLVGVRGLPISSLIVSTAQLQIPNLGPYLRVTLDCFSGGCPFAMRLYGTNRANLLSLVPGDSILIDERDLTLAAHTSMALYPDDFYAGPMRLYIQAPAGFTATLYGADLLMKWWPLDQVQAPGSATTIAPFGAWLVVISNFTGSADKFTLSVTPDVTQQAKRGVRR